MSADLIIGGGPAGAALAIRLASAGRAVRLVEREVGAHDKVCGEFLSWEAERYLIDLGVDPSALGAAPIREVELSRGERRTLAPLPFRAVSLSRRILDEALLTRAAAAGARIERGRRVTGLEPIAGGWRARLADEGVVEAPRVFLATGKHDLRGWRRPPGAQPDLVGFKQHWTLAGAQADALEGRVELHLFDGGYAGLEFVERRRVNLCLVVRRVALAAAGGTWEGLLGRLTATAPSLARRLAGARAELARPLAISAIPYGHVRGRADRLWRLGDQAAVIPSLTGEGMSIALHSARLAAEAVLAGRTADDYQRALAGDVRRQVARATLISQALVRPWSQAAITGLVGLAPGLLSWTAAATRISARAIAGAPPAVTHIA